MPQASSWQDRISEAEKVKRNFFDREREELTNNTDKKATVKRKEKKGTNLGCGKIINELKVWR